MFMFGSDVDMARATSNPDFPPAVPFTPITPVTMPFSAPPAQTISLFGDFDLRFDQQDLYEAPFPPLTLTIPSVVAEEEQAWQDTVTLERGSHVDDVISGLDTCDVDLSEWEKILDDINSGPHNSTDAAVTGGQ